MSKLVFMFPGQASQYPGMGRELADNYEEAWEIFAKADVVLEFPLSEMCFKGTEEELRRTENTQPAILTCSVAACRILEKKGIRPDYVAGHSLGEYSALVAAGALSFGDALRIVRKRGRYMQEAVAEGVGAMAAIMKLPLADVEQICGEAAHGEVVSPANINSPDQIVISGHDGAVRRAVSLAKERGARRAVLLQVSAPFHCELMRPAQERLAPELEAIHFNDLKVPLVNNVRAEVVRKSVDAKAGLIAQVSSPVRWEQSMRKLASLGADRFIEVGPGKVLCGLLRQIEPSVKGFACEDEASLAAVVEAVSAQKQGEKA